MSMFAACKGETVIQKDQRVVDDLNAANSTIAEKNKLIETLTAEAAKCTPSTATPANEIVVSFENNIITVKPALPGQTRPVSDAAAKGVSDEFQNLVAKSRGAIQKCYEQALKKDSGLQARSQTIIVSASFTDTGAYANSSFSPQINTAFDECMRAIAAKWTLSKNPAVKTFKAPVALVPS
jgi:hypothetical protein